MQFFQELMPSLRLARWAPAVLRKHLSGGESEPIESLCAMMMASDGEYSSLLLAERILNAFERLDDESRLNFFTLLMTDYDVDIDAIKATADDYARYDDAKSLLRLTAAAEPRRQELLRRINLTPGGTRRLVKMREHLMNAMREQPELKKIDWICAGVVQSIGFLLMQPIDWTTPAHILEKIIAYEAVHEIESWSELRRRLQPSDRYCYGFFHPSMEDEPLVFVEVALTDEIPRGIGEILQPDPDGEVPDNPSCAIFYSISNCHAGLGGVSFGNFLIKQVATSLKLRFPQLKTFCTISPAPGFRRWLENEARDDAELESRVEDFDTDADDAQRERMARAAARYYLTAKKKTGEPVDPVARFHLKNGAMLERINVLGNPSDKGMESAYGLMVNYVYDLSRVEENHEKYVQNNEVICSSQVRKLL